MQRYGKICTNTRKRTKKFTLSLFLARFFATFTVTTPLALDYHPEDARRVRDVLAFLSSLYVVYRYIPYISIVFVYPWYTFGIALLIRSPIPRTFSRVPPSFPQKKREHFCPRLNIILNSKFLIHNYSTSPVPSRCTLHHCV